MAHADLLEAILSQADVSAADLSHASLLGANLSGANCQFATFSGTALRDAKLRGAVLSEVQMDVTTSLAEATIDSKTQLADVIWTGAQVTRVDCETVKRLGDEAEARRNTDDNGRRKDKYARLRDYQTAVRAYQQVAPVLRTQGLQDYADRFAYRAQVCQRIVLRRQRRYLRFIGSLLLAVSSGYGYHPLQCCSTYLLVVGSFAVTYYLLGNTVNPPLDPLGASVFSITSFHGRGFAPGENVLITNPLTVLAAIGAIVGLLIEITFIAAFTQRFFAR